MLVEGLETIAKTNRDIKVNIECYLSNLRCHSSKPELFEMYLEQLEVAWNYDYSKLK